MSAAGENDIWSFLKTPEPGEDRIPPALCLIAEDVVAGLEVVIQALRGKAPDPRRGAEMVEYERRLKKAGEYFVHYFESLYRVECVPFLNFMAPAELNADRLGALPDGDYALYDSQALLRPGVRLPINYAGYHMVPPYNSERDILPGSQDARQLYIGYAPGRMGEMTGWALSWNQLRILYESEEVSLEAVPKSQLAAPGLEGGAGEALSGFIRREK